MRMENAYRHVLLATTVLALAVPASQATAQQSDGTEDTDPTQEVASGEGFQIDGQDLITRGQAILELDVVNPDGQTLGRLADFIVNFSEAEVQYALLTVANGGGNGQQAQQEGEEDEEQDAEATGNERLYPIPLAALSLEERREAAEEDAAESESESEPEEEQTAEAESDEQDRAEQLAEDYPVYAMKVDEITGTDVYNEEGEEIAAVREVIVDPASQDARAVLGVGGFLGIGEKSVAIPLEQFRYSEEESRFILAMTPEELQDLSEAEYSDEDLLESDARPAEVVAREFDSRAKAARQEAREEDRMDAAKGEDAYPLENMVLVLDIKPEDLRNAPSFGEGEFPAVRDKQWHEGIVAFYGELLEGEPAGMNGEDAMNGEPGAKTDEPAEAEEETQQ